MKRLKYNFDFLLELQKRDNFEIIEEYNIKKLNSKLIITFKCKCGNFNDKKFELLYKYGGFCVKCQKEIRNERFKKTCQERFNCDNISQNKDIKKKKIETSKEHYGTEHPQQSKIIREKTKQTNIVKYGTKYTFQSEIIKEKIKKTIINEYNVDNVFQNEKIKEKIKKIINIAYGVDNVSQNEDIKKKKIETSIKHYGYNYPMQNKELFRKQQKTSYSKKEYKFPSGKIVTVQGYENLALDILIKQYKEEDIFTSEELPNYVSDIDYINENDKEAIYYPDIFIESKNLIIEVKSTYTYNIDKDKNLCKKEICELQGFNFEFWIFNNKKELLIL